MLPGATVEVLEASYAALQPVMTHLVELLVNRLADHDSELRSKFANFGKHRSLAKAVDILMKSLKQRQVFRRMLADLGRRHASYGTDAAHFALFAKAFVGAAESCVSSEAWTPATQEAWLQFFDYVARAMLAGSGKPVPSGTDLGILTVLDREEEHEEAVRPDSALIPEAAVPSAAEVYTMVEETYDALSKGKQFDSFASEFFSRVAKKSEGLASAMTGSTSSYAGREAAFHALLARAVRDQQLDSKMGALAQELAELYTSLGSNPSHLRTAGSCLIEALGPRLSTSSRWTPECEYAWVQAAAQLSQRVLRAAGDDSVAVQDLGLNASKRLLLRREQEAATRANRPVVWLKFAQVVLKPVTRLAGIVEEWFWAQPAWQVILCVVLVVNVFQKFTPTTFVLGWLLPEYQELFLTAGLVFFMKEAPARRKAAIYQAYTAIDQADSVKVSYARNIAMESLAAFNCVMHGLELPEGAQLKGLDLRGARMKRVALRGAQLHGTDLRNAQLGRSVLDGSDLRNGRLAKADLSYCSFRGASLVGADLRNASLVCTDLRDCNFTGAQLQGANFSGAVVKGAVFSQADMTDARAVSVYQFSRVADIEGATLPDGSIGQSSVAEFGMLSVIRAKRCFLALLARRRARLSTEIKSQRRKTVYLDAEPHPMNGLPLSVGPAITEHVGAGTPATASRGTPGGASPAVDAPSTGGSHGPVNRRHHSHHSHHSHHRRHRHHRHRRHASDQSTTPPRTRSQSPGYRPHSDAAPGYDFVEL